MSRQKRKNVIITEQSGNNGTVIDIDQLYVYVNHVKTGLKSAYNYTGLKRWLSDFVKDVPKNNLTATLKADSSILIPKGSWVKGIRVKGSATGIILTFNGKTYPSINSAADGHEIQPRTQYAESDIYLDITATSWGKLDIIIFI